MILKSLGSVSERASRVLAGVLLAVSLTTAALFLTGCVCEEGLRRDAVGPLFKRVADRHDAMVRGELDPASFSAADRETYLRASQILRDAVRPPEVQASRSPGS